MNKIIKTGLIVIAFIVAIAVIISYFSSNSIAQSGKGFKVDSITKTHVFISVDPKRLFSVKLDTLVSPDTNSILLFTKTNQKK